MVKPAAHDSLDGCSNRPSLKYKAKGAPLGTNSNYKTIVIFLLQNPSAGIGRQCELKLRW